MQEHGRTYKNMSSMQKLVAFTKKVDQTSGGASNLMPWPELDWSNSAKSGLKLYAPPLQKQHGRDSSIIWSDSGALSCPAS